MKHYKIIVEKYPDGHVAYPLIRVMVITIALTITLSCVVIDHYTGKQVRKTGVKASAEVLEIWDTGVRLNHNPVVGFRLLVKTADGESYEAMTKQVISIVDIPRVQPGAVLPIKVDPNDKGRVALDIYEYK